MNAYSSMFDDERPPDDVVESEDWEDEDNPDPYASGVDDDDEGEREPGEAEIPAADNPEASPSLGPRELASGRLRPWTDPKYSARLPIREQTSSDVERDTALGVIAASEAEFLYDRDEVAKAAYLLVRVPGERGVGPRLANCVAAALRSAGLCVVRHGVRPGTASNGREYHYFLRVERLDGSPPDPREVRQAVGRSENSPRVALGTSAPAADEMAEAPPRSQTGSSEAVGSELEVLEPIGDIHARLQYAIAGEARAERRALGVQHIQDRRLVEYRRKLGAQEALVRTALQLMRDLSPRDVPAAATSLEIADLRTQNARLARDVDDALELLIDREGRLTDVTERLTWFESQLLDVEASRDAMREDRETQAGASDEREALIGTLLPEIHFLQDSTSVLWFETERLEWLRLLLLLVHDYEGFLAQLRVRGGHAERVKGNPDWMEARRAGRHKVDRARMYYTDKRPTLCSEGQRWIVQLRMKSERAGQRRDIASLP